jgi:hypothetical protein
MPTRVHSSPRQLRVRKSWNKPVNAAITAIVLSTCADWAEMIEQRLGV